MLSAADCSVLWSPLLLSDHGAVVRERVRRLDKPALPARRRASPLARQLFIVPAAKVVFHVAYESINCSETSRLQLKKHSNSYNVTWGD